ncbi:ABC transporter ATP-binding protein [bacterium]|nr:ABC transporter ATP-binding protein [bacterium]
MNDIAIRTDDLRCDFGTIRAIQNLFLEVPKGKIFGFLGPNGAGKTTTIHLLLGLLEPTGGRAEVLGFDTRTHATEIRSQTGALLEHSGLYERLSAECNLEFYGRIWHMPSDERQTRMKELLAPMGLWERRKEKVGGWSHGMKQKLAIARTLLHRPQLIFLDEPTQGLDPIAASVLRDDLAGLATREGVTVFLSTHNLSEAEKLCHQVAIIRRGQLLAVDSPENLRVKQSKPHMEIHGRGFSEFLLAALRARPGVVKVEYLDNRLIIDLVDATDTAQLVSLVVSSGAQVEEVRRSDASLEEVFLTLMEEQ